MKSISILFLALVAILMVVPFGPVQAQIGAPNRPVSYGATIGPEIAFPVGNFSNVAHVGLGITGSFIYNYSPKIDFIGTSGYVSWGGKTNGVNYSAIPLEGGAKLFLRSTVPSFYFGGLFGFHFMHLGTQVVGPGGVINHASSNSTKFSLTPMIGYETKLSKTLNLDAAAKYQIVTGNFSYFSLRGAISYRFR